MWAAPWQGLVLVNSALIVFSMVGSSDLAQGLATEDEAVAGAGDGAVVGAEDRAVVGAEYGFVAGPEPVTGACLLSLSHLLYLLTITPRSWPICMMIKYLLAGYTCTNLCILSPSLTLALTS